MLEPIEVDEAVRAYMTADGRQDAEVAEALSAAVPMVNQYAPGAPSPIARNAALRVAYWLFETRAQGDSGRDVLAVSGAKSLLSPYRKRNASVLRAT